MSLSVPSLTLAAQHLKQENLVAVRSSFIFAIFSYDFYALTTFKSACFPGLSDIRIKSRDAIEVGKQLRLGCDYFLSDSRDSQEELYSISWYWTPRKSNDGIDFRLWGKSGLKYRPTYPKTTVPFFRYRKIDPDKTRKVAWDSELRGIFDVNVSQIYSITF